LDLLGCGSLVADRLSGRVVAGVKEPGGEEGAGR
jgi:hypothetical protein